MNLYNIIKRCPLFPIEINKILYPPAKEQEYIEWRSPLLNQIFYIPLNKLKSTKDSKGIKSNIKPPLVLTRINYFT